MRIGNYLANCFTVGTLRAAYRLRQVTRYSPDTPVTIHPGGEVHSGGRNNTLNYPILWHVRNRVGVNAMQISRDASVWDIARDLHTLKKESGSQAGILELRAVQLRRGSEDSGEITGAARFAWAVRSTAKSIGAGAILGGVIVGVTGNPLQLLVPLIVVTAAGFGLSSEATGDYRLGDGYFATTLWNQMKSLRRWLTASTEDEIA